MNIFTKFRNIFANIKANEHAVSPVVATFILIIVAVVGAAAVGAMMGVIGEDVGAAADADRVGDASRVLIELGACSTEWGMIRPHAVNFTLANQGVGVQRIDITCKDNAILIRRALRDGIIDIGAPCDDLNLTATRRDELRGEDIRPSSVNISNTASIHFLTLGDPSPTEQAFITYMRFRLFNMTV